MMRTGWNAFAWMLAVCCAALLAGCGGLENQPAQQTPPATTNAAPPSIGSQDLDALLRHEWPDLPLDSFPPLTDEQIVALGYTNSLEPLDLEESFKHLRDRNSRVVLQFLENLGTTIRENGDKRWTTKRMIVERIAPLIDDDYLEIRLQSIDIIGLCGEDALPAMDQLAVALRDSNNAQIKSYAAWALAQLGEASRPLIPLFVHTVKNAAADEPNVIASGDLALARLGCFAELKDFYQNSQGNTSTLALTHMGFMRPFPDEALELLLDAAREDNPLELRRAALNGLVLCNADDPRILGLLKDALSSSDRELHTYIAMALPGMDVDSPFLGDLLNFALASPHDIVQEGATKALENEKLDRKARILLLLRAYARSDRRYHSAGDQVASLLQQQDEAGLRLLLSMATDPAESELNRCLAARVLGNVVRDARWSRKHPLSDAFQRELAATVRAWLDNPELSLAFRTAAVLGAEGRQFGSEETPLTHKDLITDAMLHAEVAVIRQDAALWHAEYWETNDSEPPDESISPIAALIEALADKDERTAEYAAEVLARYGKRASAAVPALRTALADKQSHGRSMIAVALGRTGDTSDETAQTLMDVVGTDPDLDVRANAANTLGKLGRQRAELAPEILNVLRATYRDKRALRPFVLQAYGEMGPAAAPMVDELLAMLEPANPQGRQQAEVIRALGKIKSRPEDVVPVVLREFAEDDQIPAAMDALGSFGPDAASAVPQLIALLEKDLPTDELSVPYACAALRAIGPAARPAIPILQTAKKPDGTFMIHGYVATQATLLILAEDPAVRADAAAELIEMQQRDSQGASAVWHALRHDYIDITDEVLEFLRSHPEPRIQHSALQFEQKHREYDRGNNWEPDGN